MRYLFKHIEKVFVNSVTKGEEEENRDTENRVRWALLLQVGQAFDSTSRDLD